MPLTIGANAYSQVQSFPGAAQKGSMDQQQLEKQANAEVENRPARETSAVASRPKPVQAKEDSAKARLEQLKQDSEQQQSLIEGGVAMKLEKGARIDTYV